MLRWPVIVFAGMLLGKLQAQTPGSGAAGSAFSRTSGPPTITSASGQFTVHGADHTGWLPALGQNPDVVRLDPQLLAISCEKIKAALLKELALPNDHWRGRIRLELHPAASLDETIQINSVRFADGWTYRVELPDAIERSRLVTTLVPVLLLEFVNRASAEPVEIPPWLVAGLAQQVQLGTYTDLVLDSPRGMEAGVNLTRVSREVTNANSLFSANQRLRGKPPLTLDELSWAGPEQFQGEDGAGYRDSAQLLVCELCALPDGRASLRAFLEGLPRQLNWQLAFLKAFHSDFTDQRAFEKWWELVLVNFSGRDLAQTWPPDESWRKLDEIIRPRVQVRLAADEMPMSTGSKLQTIVREWNLIPQADVLNAEIQQLAQLRAHVCRDLVPLVDDYRLTLEDYLKSRETTTYGHLPSNPALIRLRQAQDECASKLDTLDARREQLRPQAAPANEAGGAPSEITATH